MKTLPSRNVLFLQAKSSYYFSLYSL